MPALISELVRAANETQKLSPVEVSRLLDRSTRTIRELRQQVGIIPFPGRDTLIPMETLGFEAAKVPQEEWRHGLLQVAEMIRDLHIVVVSGTTLKVT